MKTLLTAFFLLGSISVLAGTIFVSPRGELIDGIYEHRQADGISCSSSEDNVCKKITKDITSKSKFVKCDEYGYRAFDWALDQIKEHPYAQGRFVESILITENGEAEYRTESVNSFSAKPVTLISEIECE